MVLPGEAEMRPIRVIVRCAFAPRGSGIVARQDLKLACLLRYPCYMGCLIEQPRTPRPNGEGVHLFFAVGRRKRSGGDAYRKDGVRQAHAPPVGVGANVSMQTSNLAST